MQGAAPRAPHHPGGIPAFRHTGWMCRNTLELLALTEFWVVNTFPGKSLLQLFSTMATLLVSRFDVSRGNHRDSEHKACLGNAAMGRPFTTSKPFKRHHFHNSPGKPSTKLPTLLTGFKENSGRFIDHLPWQTQTSLRSLWRRCQ